MRKSSILFLTLLAVIVLTVGCHKKSDTVVTDASDITENDTEELIQQRDESYYIGDLSDETFDDYNYRILVRKGALNTQYFDAPQEHTVNDAIYRRNKAVEERFNIKISAFESTNGDYETDALNAILAGDDAYDVIFTHSRAAFTYAVQGACYNALDIDSLHLDKPWWSQNIVDSCSLNNRLYVLDGDISITGLSNTMVLFFNKRIFDDLGLDYPYEMVHEGEWTFDEFAYLARKGGADLNGDGVIKPEDDRYGFWTSVWSAPINVLYAGGEKIYDKDSNGELQLTLYSNKTVKIFDDFFSLATNEAVFVNDEDYFGSDPFPQGRVMFAANGLGTASSYRNMEDDFGILPYPKYDESDDYGTAINGWAPLMIIPITVSDTERTGAITEALAAYGSQYVLPAFYDVSLKTKYSRDDESKYMMDIIHDSTVFDIGYLCGGPYASHGRALNTIPGHSFSSWYTAREEAAKESLAAFKRDYAGIE
ncbi:MAG: carbohydrate ABC transporter substrate-binding protein [Clostridia bacterium]|nr:carbohydrate ABC transporter substrate-binding protein [Clostridia bacterium]